MSSVASQEALGEGPASAVTVRDRVTRAGRGTFPLFVGTPAERARELMLQRQDHVPGIAESCLEAGGLLDSKPARRWLDLTTQILADRLPDVIDYFQATAAVCGVTLDEILAWVHKDFLRSEASTEPVEPIEDEGCSTGAARLASGGAWVAKNRDNSPDVMKRHLVALHRDPSWSGRTIAVQSHSGGPLAASSGVNSDGLCIVSTAIPALGAPPAVLRSLLLGELLGRCATVDEALEVIDSLPHLGGTFTLVDAKGVVASVELNPDAVAVERASGRSWVARTNHYCLHSIPGPEPVSTHLEVSALRLETMCETMPEVSAMDAPWPELEVRIAERMTTHGDAGVCRHPWQGNSVTISTSILRSDPPSLLTSLGPGCENEWVRWSAR